MSPVQNIDLVRASFSFLKKRGLVLFLIFFDKRNDIIIQNSKVNLKIRCYNELLKEAFEIANMLAAGVMKLKKKNF